jgi:hypothetical protein
MIASMTASLVAPGMAQAKSPSKKKAPEVYAATDVNEIQAGTAAALPVEDDTAPLLSSQNVQVQEAAPQKKTAAPKQKQKTPRAVASAASAKANKPVAVTAKAVAFDVVPADQSNAILERLKIVEELIRKYGRAYDYRTHTLKELQLIQGTLESTSAARPVAAQVQAQAPAPAPAPAATAVAAPAPAAAAPAAPQSDAVVTGQAAAQTAPATVENSDEVNLKALPTPIELDAPNADETGN